mgnify:CR=1 FL=1
MSFAKTPGNGPVESVAESSVENAAEGLVTAKLEKVAGAMGPSTLALMISEKRALKALALDGVAPSAQTIANGSYPLVKHVLMVTGPKSPPEAQAFVTFVQSAPGREILRQTGHWVK